MSVTEEIALSRSSKYCHFFSYCEILRITNLLLAVIICLFYMLVAFKYNCFINGKALVTKNLH